MRFAVARAGQHAGRLSLLAVLVALIVVGVGGVETFAERMLQTGVSSIFDDAEPRARTAVVIADATAGGETLDGSVRDAIESTFSGTDVVVSRRVSSVLDLGSTTNGPLSIGLLDDPRVPALTILSAGSWPTSAGQIALPDAAAERLHLRIGSAVGTTDGGPDLTLVGIWAADDPLDPAWQGDPSVVSGENDGVIGPAMVAPGSSSTPADTQMISWEVAPVRVEISDIPALQLALTNLQGLPDAVDPGHEYGIRVQGALGDTLQRQATAISATRGLLLAPLLIIVLLGAVVLGIIVTTLSVTRSEELALLRARGASAVRLSFAAAAEAFVFAAAGAVLALVILLATVGVIGPALPVAAGSAVIPAVIAAVLTLRRVGGADIPRPDAQRGDAAVALPLVLLPAAVAVGLGALSAWQLFATRTVVRADGAPEPLAAVAPALMLIAACALVPVAAAPLAAVVAGLVRRTSGISPPLPLRQISRRMGGTAVAILCLALAAGCLALARAAPAAADAAQQRTVMAVLGGDVRMISDGGLDVHAAAAVRWDGVTDAAEILNTPIVVGADSAALVAGPARAIGIDRPSGSGTGAALRATVTRTLAERLAADEGTVFTAQIRSVARPVSIEVTRIVEQLPGVGEGWGIGVDISRLASVGVDLTANELWLRSDDPAATAAQLRAHTTHPVRILTAAQIGAAPVTAVAPAALTAGAGAAAVLGALGFAAASSASSRARRSETLVLRALGLSDARQRAMRIGEVITVAAYALLVGALVGVVIAEAVLPIVLGVSA